MMSEKKIQLLLSTMKHNDLLWLKKLNIASDAVVINQCGRKDKKVIHKEYGDVLWFDSDEVGLSKSRNMALDNASGDYLVIADDDLEYVDSYNDIICEAFKKKPRADIVTFQVEGIEQEFKKYGKKAKKISYFSSLHVSSVEIVIRKDSIKKYNIRFDERFGAGAKYRMGEENIFLFACLKAGMNIYYEPKVIARLHMNKSTWFRGFNKKYFFDRGAISRKLYGNIGGLFMIIAFSLKNYKRYKDDMGILSGLKYMICGYKEFGKK